MSGMERNYEAFLYCAEPAERGRGNDRKDSAPGHQVSRQFDKNPKL